MWTFYRMMFTNELEATNAAQRTIETYSLAVDQFGTFLREQGMPTDPTQVTREHLIEWIRYLQRTRSPATANQRYRSISRFFKFLLDQGEIQTKPMPKMSPPKVPEKLVPVVQGSEPQATAEVVGWAGLREPTGQGDHLRVH